MRKPRNGKATPEAFETGPWMLRGTDASDVSFDTPEKFGDALRNAMNDAKDVELLFAIWEQNVDTVRAINRSVIHRSKSKIGFAQSLVKHLKVCAIALARAGNGGNGAVHSAATNTAVSQPARIKIDKSVLTISEPKRHRSKEHLRFVAQQPCLVCGRSPSQAHHVRFAQPRGLGLKVSDEFAVPLCAIHHMQNHATGDERKWWQENKLDPLEVAAKLWRESYPTNLPNVATSTKSLEP